LKENVEKNKNYINAYKYLYKFQEIYDSNSSVFTLQVNNFIEIFLNKPMFSSVKFIKNKQDSREEH
jgi:hypothetical protein